MVPDCGYNVVGLRIGQNNGGPPYPHLTLKGEFKTWEDAQKHAKLLDSGQPVKAERILILPTEKRLLEPPFQTLYDKIQADYEFNTPKKGYALCAVDCFEEPGYQVFWLGKYNTYEEALAARKEISGPDGRSFILPNKRAVEPE
jgi:hypothetical protein